MHPLSIRPVSKSRHRSRRSFAPTSIVMKATCPGCASRKETAASSCEPAAYRHGEFVPVSHRATRLARAAHVPKTELWDLLTDIPKQIVDVSVRGLAPAGLEACRERVAEREVDNGFGPSASPRDDTVQHRDDERRGHDRR